MIKVTFKTPLYMQSDDVGMCEVLFIFCKCIEYKFTHYCYVDTDGTFKMNTPAMALIKSIEHVKPTEL